MFFGPRKENYMQWVKKDPFIIAEIGSNWVVSKDYNRNLDAANMCCQFAADMGANAVKFQLHTHQELYGEVKPSEYDLPWDWVALLDDFCEEL